MSTVSNVILDQGGTNEITIYSIQIEETINKKLTKVPSFVASDNWSLGPQDERIIDLLRIEELFTVVGFINESDKSKIKNLVKQGGVFDFTYEDGTISVNIDKVLITTDKSENDELTIRFTCSKGVDLV